MTNLIPVKRVDKNGVLTTKHVRANPVNKNTALAVPAPSMSGSVNSPTPTPSTVQKRWRVHTRKWGSCDDELKHLCNTKFTALQQYECSDAEAYDVMTAVHPENALPLLAIGFREGEKASTFLEETGLSRLQQDSSQLAEEAIARGIPARELLEFSANYHQYVNLPQFLDAAEYWSTPALKQADQSRSEYRVASLRPVRELILDGHIAWSDIQEIGTTKFASATVMSDHLINHIKFMHEGGAKSEFKSIGEIAELLSATPEKLHLDIAATYGVDAYKRIASNKMYTAERYAEAFRSRDGNRGDIVDVLEYAQNVGMNPTPEYVVALYDARITAEEARQGVIDGLEATQVIGLKSGEVQPSLSSGYL